MKASAALPPARDQLPPTNQGVGPLGPEAGRFGTAHSALAVADLVADPENRRLHNAKNLDMVTAALREVGAARSIVIDEANVVLAGNGVTAAAAAAGITRVRVIEAAGDELIAVRRRGLTDDQKRALAIYDNRTAELAAWNFDQLAADQAGGLSLEPFWTAAEAAALLPIPARRDGLTDPDAVPAARPTTIRTGDLFQLGAHRLLCGDATVPAAVARVLGGQRAALCFTSPPYARQRTYTNAGDLAPAHLAQFLAAAAPHADLVAVNLGLSRRDGIVDRYWDAYLAAAESAGLALVSWNVWSREAMPMSVGQVTAMFPIQHEWIFVFGRGPRRLRPTVANKTAGSTHHATNRRADGSLSAKKAVTIRPHRALGTVISLAPVQDNADHPAQFPVGLPLAYIEAVPGAVFDPFVGSGTTIIACEQLQRACYAIDLAPSYCQVAIDRWEAFTGGRAVHLEHELVR